ncbi:MAG: MFS transporter [Chloroflexi bacterium]|nr:MFS transporter [Chloroflexota bacterium]
MTAQQRAVGRNLALDVVAAIGVGVMAALISTLLPTIARRGGLEPIGLAALAAAPYLANLLGAFAGRVGPRSQRQLALLRGFGAASLLVLLVFSAPPVMVAVTFAFWLSLALSGPFYLRLWGSMYPARIRGRVVGVLGSAGAAAAALAAFMGGHIADQVGGVTVVALAGIVGLACASSYLALRAPDAPRPPAFSARDSIRALREQPVLVRMAVAQLFYGGGLVAAAPLYAIVNVDRLHLSLADVGIIGILTAGATTVSFLLWGAVADRKGPLVAMRLGTTLGLAALFAYALAPQVVVLWIAAVAAGAGSASIEVGIASAVSNHTPLTSRAAAMAGWNAITGARGIVAAFFMTTLLQIGLVDVTLGLLLCRAISAVGVLMYATTSPVVDAEPVTQRSRVTRAARGLRSAFVR